MHEARRRDPGQARSVSLAGKQSSVEIIWGGEIDRSDVPLVCASTLGYSPLTSALRGASDPVEVENLSGWLRTTLDGPFIGLLDGREDRRPVALIQPDVTVNETTNYYESHRPRPDRGIWRDFYFQTVLAAVREADDRWSPEEIELTHATGGAWTRDLLAVSLEALGHLVDRHDLSCSSIRLGCIHGVDEDDFVWAMEQLNVEQRQNSREVRDVQVSKVDPRSVGIPNDVNGTVLRIQVGE